MKLFGRRVAVQFQRPGATATSIEGLRVSGRAQRTTTKKPDAASFRIYGVSDQHITDLQTPGCVVRVLAGLNNQLAVMLAGTVRPSTIEVKRQEGEVTIAAEVVDSRTQVRAAPISRAWDRVKASEVIPWAIERAGLVRGSINLGIDVDYLVGFVALGIVGDVLNQLAADTQSTLVIQDGVVSFFPIGSQRRATSLLISPESGLVGSPAKSDKGHVEVTSLLVPTVRPGDGFRLESADLSGDFVALDVEHDFDSWDGPFYSLLRARRA